MLQRLILSVTAGVLLTLAAFAQPPAQLPADTKTVIQGNNQFAFDLYGQLRGGDGNLFFSPYSISNALAMTYAGARGETAAEMARTLHFEQEQAALHPAFGKLVQHLTGPALKRPYQLNVANALWGQKGYAFNPAFLKTTEESYSAGLKQLDFGKETEQARQTINAWVEEQTQQKIKDLIPQGVLQGDTRLVLTNAIYFKASWEEAFNEKRTENGTFHTSAASKSTVPLMHKGEIIPYYSDDELQAVSLPYQQGALSMIVLLPKKVDGLAELEKGLTAAKVDTILGKMKRYQVDLKLPKFKMTAQFNLKKQLVKMGMPLAFSGGADFSGMTSQEKLFIDQVIHKAFVDVNEKGTEAAAATAVIMRPTSVQIVENATFHADHPFTFALRDNRSGSVLFLGRVVEPAGK